MPLHQVIDVLFVSSSNSVDSAPTQKATAGSVSIPEEAEDDEDVPDLEDTESFETAASK